MMLTTMVPASRIDPATRRAYRETEYRVFADPPFTLHVGRHAPELAELHQAAGVGCSAFVTACNPCSTKTGDAVNMQRQATLARVLRARGLTAMAGIGQHPGNGWPGEASFLVPGLSREAACALGTRFGQNAIVWSGADAVPQLILLR